MRVKILHRFRRHCDNCWRGPRPCYSDLRHPAMERRPGSVTECNGPDWAQSSSAPADGSDRRMAPHRDHSLVESPRPHRW